MSEKDGVQDISIKLVKEELVINNYLPKAISLGSTLTYIIIAENASNETVDATLKEVLDVKLIYDSTKTETGSAQCVGQEITWNIGTLTAGAKCLLEVKVVPREVGDVSNTTTMSGVIGTEVIENSIIVTSKIIDMASKVDNIDANVTVIDTNVDLLIEKVDGTKPSAIKDIKDMLAKITPMGTYVLLTGIVVKDFSANSLVAAIDNTTESPVQIEIAVIDYTKPGAIPRIKTVSIEAHSSKSYVLGDAPLQYEVVFIGIKDGVYAWTSSRTNDVFDSINLSSFVASNTFRYSELAMMRMVN